jgi:ribosomal protein L37E
MRLVKDDANDEDDAGIDSDHESLDEKAEDEIVLVQCKHCGKTTWEASVSCEHCGYFIRLEDRPRWRKWWWVVGVVAVLLCVIRWILH